MAFSGVVNKLRTNLSIVINFSRRRLHFCDLSACMQTGQDKVRVAKKQIRMSLNELHEEFKHNHPTMTIGLTKFSLLRPRNCIWPGPTGHHVTCVCIIHENFRVLREAAGLAGNTNELLQRYLCKDATELCFLDLCCRCPFYESLKDDLDIVLPNILKFNLWESTDRPNLVSITETKDQFMQRFVKEIPKLAKHHFISQQQSSFVQDLKQNLDSSRVVCTVDFGMNYSFIGQNEPQSVHFSRAQCTVHPFVVDGVVGGAKVQKKFVVLSDELNHNTTTFHVFRSEVVPFIKQCFSDVSKIHYVSDGSAAQYKNYKNVANLVFHERELQLAADWNFTATAHGKSTCDAIAAVVKRETRLESLKGRVIQTVQQMVNFFKEKPLQNIQIVHVTQEKVQSRVVELEARYSKVNKFRGIQQIHSIIPIQGSKSVELRKYSSSEDSIPFCVFSSHALVTPLDPSESPVGKFVAVKIGLRFALGTVDGISDELGTVSVSFMRRFGNSNKFQWPEIPRVEEVLPSLILMCMGEMDITAEGFYAIPPSTLQQLNRMKKANSSTAGFDTTEVERTYHE